MPKKLNDKAEEYRAWKEDTADFFDTQMDGMGDFLMQVSKFEGNDQELEEMIKGYTGKNNIVFGEEDSIMVCRALKRLTEGVAQNIILNTRLENGFLAWE